VVLIRDEVKNMDSNITTTTFFAQIDESTSALRFSGNQTGGRLTLGFDNSQLPDVIKVTAMTRKNLRVTIEVVDE